MIMMDLLSTNKTLGRYLALVALFALLPSLLILNVPWMTVYAGVLIAYAAVLGAQMTDERNGWERFRQALPLTRAQVVAGRAAFVAIGAFVGTALGVFVYLGACAVRQLPAFAAMTGAGAPDLPQLALSVAFALACSLVMAGIVLMLTARFGLTKAVRFLPGAFLALLLLFPSDPQRGRRTGQHLQRASQGGFDHARRVPGRRHHGGGSLRVLSGGFRSRHQAVRKARPLSRDAADRAFFFLARM